MDRIIQQHTFKLISSLNMFKLRGPIDGYDGEQTWITNPPFQYNTHMISGNPLRNYVETNQERKCRNVPPQTWNK